MTAETVIANPQQYNHVLAFEVSKAKLHVYILPGGQSCEVSNDRASVRRLIRNEKRRNARLGVGPLLVVCEATGTYSSHVIACADELEVACHRAHGSRVRAFAKFRGTHAKSDPTDVRLIADYATASRDLRLYRPPHPAQAELRELIARRTELRQAKEAEEARTEHVTSKVVVQSLRALIRALERSLAQIEARIEALMQEVEEFRRKGELMQSVKGVGPITAATVLAYLPEIGSVSRGTIAALAGLAPFDDDSGESQGRRHIFGGRAEARAGLYMAAKVAMRWNAHLAALAGRIEADGKPFKVQVTAVMRKLVVILNAVVASQVPCRMPTAGRGGPSTPAWKSIPTALHVAPKCRF